MWAWEGLWARHVQKTRSEWNGRVVEMGFLKGVGMLMKTLKLSERMGRRWKKKEDKLVGHK